MPDLEISESSVDVRGDHLAVVAQGSSSGVSSNLLTTTFYLIYLEDLPAGVISSDQLVN